VAQEDPSSVLPKMANLQSKQIARGADL